MAQSVGPLSAAGGIALEWSFLALSLIFLLMRGYVVVGRLSKAQPLCDLFVLFGWCIALAMTCCDTVSYASGLLDESILDDATLSKSYHVNYASTVLFDVGIWFPKASLIAFYFGLIPFTYPRLRRALWGTTVYVSLAALGTLLSDTLWCRPISDNWSTDPSVCAIVVSDPNLILDWAFDISSDVLIFLLPLPMMKDLHLHGWKKGGVILTFLLGFITMAVSTARFVSLHDFSIPWPSAVVWSAAEIYTSIIVVSLPRTGILLRGFKRWRRQNAQPHDPNEWQTSALQYNISDWTRTGSTHNPYEWQTSALDPIPRTSSHHSKEMRSGGSSTEIATP